MTFSLEHHPKDIVKYDHDDLYFTFYNLSTQLKELLETVIPSRCVPIPLEKTRDTLYVGRIEDERLLKEAGFDLAVRADAGIKADRGRAEGCQDIPRDG